MKCTINADDFGWSKSCTDAIVYCFENGYIDTTTMMPTGYSYEYALECIEKSEFSDRVGIHVNLTEGRPLTDDIRWNKQICDSNGMFDNRIKRYSIFTLDEKRQIYEELKAQINKYIESGVAIHHIDSHHHIHTSPYIIPIVYQIMLEYDIKSIRIHRNIGDINKLKKMLKALFNQFLKQKKIGYTDAFGSLDDIAYQHNILKRKGDLELMCHPDYNFQGELIDRDGESYTDPQGLQLIDKLKIVRPIEEQIY